MPAPIKSSSNRPSTVSPLRRLKGRNGNGWWVTISSARWLTASSALAGVIVRQVITRSTRDSNRPTSKPTLSHASASAGGAT
jgi:hypothetical protein